MNNMENRVILYQASGGALELRGDIFKETIWATQAQIADIFGIERSVVTKHIGNVFKSGEVNKKSNVQKMHIANSDKPAAFYSLDIILAVGYRANSARAIDFRKWATKILREHIIKGYTINKKRIVKNYDSFMKAVDGIKVLLPAAPKIDNTIILELIKTFADTWISLDAYDKDKFIPGKITRKKLILVSDELTDGINELKLELRKKGEASELFAMERHNGSFEGIIGNIMQTFGGKDLYPSIEEKAAHLLYFIIKNHPFADGNKRSGAFSFVWFLRRAGILNTRRLTPQALTALTLLIAESHPKDKEKMTKLVVMLLRK